MEISYNKKSVYLSLAVFDGDDIMRKLTFPSGGLKQDLSTKNMIFCKINFK